MIVEERTYTFRPGAVAEFLRLHEAEGLALHLRYLGRAVGFYVSETGTLNQTVMLWAYEDAADRSRRRDALAADPAWQAYLGKVRPLMVAQSSRLLAPAPAFRERLAEIADWRKP